MCPYLLQQSAVAASARSSSARHRRSPKLRVQRHNGSSRPRGSSSSPSRRWSRRFLPGQTPPLCRPKSGPRRVGGRRPQRGRTHAAMRGGFSRKLLQEAYVALVEQLDLFHLVLEDRDALHAHAERKPADLRRVVAVLLHEIEDVGVHHAAAKQLDPAAALALAATFAAAENTAYLHVGAGLGEGEKRRIEARLYRRAEQRLHGVVERALQVAEGDVGVHREPFD